jgi:WD40 repeat protein
MSQSPFKFLDSYTKDDKDIFFGREREVEELYQKVFDSKMLVIYGVSGTGKTSLINCGLANKFQDADWLPISIRRGKDMIQSLIDELSAVEGSTEPKKSKSNQDRIIKTIRSIYLDHFKPIYLLFDQFEEIFIFGSKEERKEFALIIKSISESDLSCKILFSIREEYLASLTEMERFIPNILQNRFRVERMNRQNAISVIEGPCNKFGIAVEEGFPDALLDRLGEGGANIELTYLQVYLDKIYRTAYTPPVIASEERAKQPERSEARRSQSAEDEKIASQSTLAMTFTIEILNQIGDVKNLLGTFLNEQIAKMEKPDLANAILKSFVSAKGTKKQLSIDEATEAVQVFNPDAKAEQIREYIVNFVNLRILRGEDEEGRYELRHDSLAAKIFEKISVDEMELLEVRQFIENALLNYNKRQILLSPDDFEYIGGRENRLKLSSELREFVEKSKENIRVKNRTVKRLTFLSAAALALIVLVLGKVVVDNEKLTEAKNFAYLSILQYKNVEQRLISASNSFNKNELVTSHEALIKAFNMLQDGPTGNQKLDSIRSLYFYTFESALEPIIHGECTKNDNIFGFTSNYVIIWNSTGKIRHMFKHEKEKILNCKISADEKFVGILTPDSLLTLYRVDGTVLFTRKIYYNILNPKQSFALTSTNQVITNHGNKTVILDTFGKEIQVLQGHNNTVNALSVTNDDKFIASVAYDTTTKIWYYNNVKQCYSLYNSLKYHQDTVWSVNFANQKYYVITASKDKLVFACDFNSRGLLKLQGDSTYCYAEFSANDFGIISRRYRFEDGNLKFTDIGDYIYKFHEIVLSQGSIEFQDLHFSPTTIYYAYSLDNKIFVGSTRSFQNEVGNFIVFETNGNYSFFSTSGNYLYVIDGTSIKPIFISAESINQIVNRSLQKPK